MTHLRRPPVLLAARVAALVPNPNIHRAQHPKAPQRFVAGGADLGPGLMSLPHAEQLGLDASELETLALAEEQAYYVVQKIVATQDTNGNGTCKSAIPCSTSKFS